jgi:N-acetylmuramoyl-L-alanine amidase CwlA
MLLTSQQNRSGKKLLKIKGVVIHYTGNTGRGANAVANRNYFNNTTTYASAHYIVDDHSIIRCIPDNEVAWHVGAKSYTPIGMTIKENATPNYYLIGIEMCVNSDGDWNKTYQYTAELAAFLLRKYNLTMDNLYRHYDITGKLCPAMMVNNAEWSKFRLAVATVIGAAQQPAQPKPAPNPRTTIKRPVGYDEYFSDLHRIAIHGANPVTYISLDKDAIRFYVNGKLSYQYANADPVINQPVSAVKNADYQITTAPFGYDAYIFKTGRRIMHLNTGTYISLDPHGIQFYVNGKHMGGFTSERGVITGTTPSSVPGSMDIVPTPLGYDQYLLTTNRRIIHLNLGTYISLDPNAIKFYVNGQCVGQFV